MWALATYLRSLPAPPPLDEPSEASRRGEQVFAREGCDTCHTPPLYTSDTRVPLDELGALAGGEHHREPRHAHRRSLSLHACPIPPCPIRSNAPC